MVSLAQVAKIGFVNWIGVASRSWKKEEAKGFEGGSGVVQPAFDWKEYHHHYGTASPFLTLKGEQANTISEESP